MTIKEINDMSQPIGDVLQGLGSQGALLKQPGANGYALLPLDEDLLDYLLERSPALIEECRAIRQRMQAGQLHSHAEVKKRLGL